VLREMKNSDENANDASETSRDPSLREEACVHIDYMIKKKNG